MRPIDLLFRLRRAILSQLRIRTRGVKVMLLSEKGEIVLIRNSYGRSDLWVMPGGGIGPWEAPASAARREVGEELHVRVAGLRFVSQHFNRSEGKRDTIHLFRGELIGEPRADLHEVEAVALFPLDALPDTVSPATRRRIDEHLGLRIADGAW